MLTNTPITPQTEVVDSGTTFQSEGRDLFDSRGPVLLFSVVATATDSGERMMLTDVTQRKKSKPELILIKEVDLWLLWMEDLQAAMFTHTNAHTHTQSAVISALHFLTQCQSATVILSMVFCSRQEIWVYVATKVIRVKIQFIFWIIFHTAAATKLNHYTKQRANQRRN